MRDVVDDQASFAKLAAEFGVAPSTDVQIDWACRPDWIDKHFPDLSNDDLRAGVVNVETDTNEVRRAGSYIRPEALLSREDWRNNALLPLVTLAVREPDLADEARAIMHQVSSKPGAFTEGYPGAANDAEWEQAYRDTERRLASGQPTRTLGSFFRAAEEGGYIRSSPAPEPAEPVAGMVATDQTSHVLADLLASRPIHKRQPEHGDLFSIGEVSLTGGSGASGKTTYLLTAVVACASGLPLLGQRVYKRRKMLLIVLEEHLDEVLLKLRATIAWHAARFNLPADTEEYITVFGAGELCDLTLTDVDLSTGRERVSKRGLARLRTEIERSEAEIAIIDPLSMLMPNAMNDNGTAYAAMQGVKQIAADARCAVLLAAHTRKGSSQGAGSADDVMGASAFVNAARKVALVRRIDAAECSALGVPYGREGNIREIADQKSNFAPLASRSFIEIVGVRMANALPPDYPDDDWIGVAVEFVPQVGGRTMPAPALRSALEKFARGLAGGATPFSSAKQGGRHYGTEVAQAIAAHFPGVTTAKLTEAAKDVFLELTNRGWVEEADFRIGRNIRKGIRVRWSMTPWSTDPSPGGSYVV